MHIQRLLSLLLDLYFLILPSQGTTALEHPQRVTVMLGVKNKERARLLWGHGNLF